jgi:hypothetical protein
MNVKLTREALAPLRMPHAHRAIDLDWCDIEAYLSREAEVGFCLTPDYQRGRVWSEAQKIAYVEHVLLGGETARDVMVVIVGRSEDDYVHGRNGAISLRGYSMLDGLQRVSAVREFIRDEFAVLTSLREGGFNWSQLDRIVQRRDLTFRWRTVVVPTQADVLKLYIRLNSGGTPHTAEEIDRVRALLRGTAT